MNMRPRRSVLYMPGANARALEKSRNLPADSLIFDLEDAVAPDAKALARQQILDTLKTGGYGKRELIVRANGLDTPWGVDDLNAIASSGANAVLLPKIDTAKDVLAAVTLLEAGGAPDDLQVWLMAETARGILNIDSITQAHR
ncbi:MAG: aldolase/citrate lyase family protein, partial [Pseudomonadota bacterium]